MSIITKTYTNLAKETALGLTEEQMAKLYSISVKGTFGGYTINGIGYVCPGNTNMIEVGLYPSSSSSTDKNANIEFSIISSGYDLQIDDVWKAGGYSAGNGPFKGTISFLII